MIAISQQQAPKETRSTRETAESRFKIAKQRLRLLEAGTRVEVIAEAQAQLRKAQADLRFLQKGKRVEELKQLRAQQMEAEARIQFVDIRLAEGEVIAPADCQVEVIPVRKETFAGDSPCRINCPNC